MARSIVTLLACAGGAAVTIVASADGANPTAPPPRGTLTARHNPKHRCAGRFVSSSRRVVIVRRAGGETAGATAAPTRYYVCLRPRGGAVLFGRVGVDDGEYGPDSELSKLVFSNTFVAAIETDGLVGALQCSKYHGDPCPVPMDSLQVADARSKRATTLAIGNQGHQLAALSTSGSAAWYSSPTALFAARFGGPANPVALQAPIQPATVRFAPDGTLQWQDTSGAPHAAALS